MVLCEADDVAITICVDGEKQADEVLNPAPACGAAEGECLYLPAQCYIVLFLPIGDAGARLQQKK